VHRGRCWRGIVPAGPPDRHDRQVIRCPKEERRVPDVGCGPSAAAPDRRALGRDSDSRLRPARASPIPRKRSSDWASVDPATCHAGQDQLGRPLVLLVCSISSHGCRFRTALADRRIAPAAALSQAHRGQASGQRGRPGALTRTRLLASAFAQSEFRSRSAAVRLPVAGVARTRDRTLRYGPNGGCRIGAWDEEPAERADSTIGEKRLDRWGHIADPTRRIQRGVTGGQDAPRQT
jgi:hypothetical protein